MASKQPRSNNDCIEKIRHSKIKVKDPGTGKSAVLLNPDKAQVRRVRMDGCLMLAGRPAADCLVSMPRSVDVIIELKGKNVVHAIEQIEATRLFWCKHPACEFNKTISAWILCSEYPRADLKINRYRENFREYGGILLISTHNGEERAFSDFVPKRP
jgi:hypothetical protein